MATRKEEFKVSGDDLLKKVKELVREGNVRRIVISNKEGKTLVELPLSIGLVGAVIAPALAAVGAIAALVTECTISVEREADEPQKDDSKHPADTKPKHIAAETPAEHHNN